MKKHPPQTPVVTDAVKIASSVPTLPIQEQKVTIKQPVIPKRSVQLPKSQPQLPVKPTLIMPPVDQDYTQLVETNRRLEEQLRKLQLENRP